eukprot:scaffold4238_cov105-Isochrysis_galbana.AAC.10
MGDASGGCSAAACNNRVSVWGGGSGCDGREWRMGVCNPCDTPPPPPLVLLRHVPRRPPVLKEREGAPATGRSEAAPSPLPKKLCRPRQLACGAVGGERASDTQRGEKQGEKPSSETKLAHLIRVRARGIGDTQWGEHDPRGSKLKGLAGLVSSALQVQAPQKHARPATRVCGHRSEFKTVGHLTSEICSFLCARTMMDLARSAYASVDSVSSMC